MVTALLCFLLAQSGGVAATTATRPDPVGAPTEVSAAIYMVDIMEINDVHQAFAADVFIGLEWKDHRLASKDAAAERTMALSDVWHPHVQVLNQDSLDRMMPEVVSVTPDGVVLYRQRYIGKFTIPLHMADFPFDSHRLSIGLIATGNTPEQVAFVPRSDINGRASNVTLAGWSIDDGAARVVPYELEMLHKQVARFELEFEVRRNALFYLLRLIGPLLLIVLIGWGTCWIDPINTGAQLRLGATGFLTLVAYQFAVGALLPKVSYLTRMDEFVAGITVVIFLALAKAVLADHLVAKDRQAAVVRINLFFRWFYFVSVMLVIVVAFAV